MTKKIHIAEEFSSVPTGRVEDDGPFNGTTFRQKFLLPALKSKQRIIINIDGLFTYGHSFFDEAIAGLCRPKKPVGEGLPGEGLKAEEVAPYIELEANTDTALFFLPSLQRLIPRIVTA